MDKSLEGLIKRPSYQSLYDLNNIPEKDENKDFMKIFKQTFDKKHLFINR